MKIELRKLKIAEHMSEETTAFTAEIFIDGVRAGYAKNSGRGGNTDYHHEEGQRDLLKKAEAHCLTLPALVIDTAGSGIHDSGRPLKPFSITMNLEHFIDDLVHEELKKKDNKQFEKRMEKSIMWGVPNSSSYTEIRQKQPLSAYNVVALQGLVDDIKKRFKTGEQFLNTNFEKLGIKI